MEDNETEAAADPYAIPLEEIDVSNPWLYRDDVIGAYFERLRAGAPVHYCADGDYGAFWSLTTYDDIVRVNAADDKFSCDYELGGHVLGYQKMFRASICLSASVRTIASASVSPSCSCGSPGKKSSNASARWKWSGSRHACVRISFTVTPPCRCACTPGERAARHGIASGVAERQRP